MQKELLRLLALMMTLTLVACGGDTGTTGPEDGDEATDGSSSSSTVTRSATLEAAVPANGAVVSGDFLLGAVVDAADLVEVRFLVDGVEVGVVNEHPYQLPMSVCDLSEGNHAYIVTIEDSNGGADYVEQFFESAPCG